MEKSVARTKKPERESSPRDEKSIYVDDSEDGETQLSFKEDQPLIMTVLKNGDEQLCISEVTPRPCTEPPKYIGQNFESREK